jgi:TRAP-type C4-dicarboxylate transport system permease small subunit
MGAVWIPDVTRFLFIWMAFLGTALMHLRDRHLLIDYVQLRLPPAVRWGTGGVIHMAMVSLAGVLLVVGWRVTQLRMDIPYTGWEVPTGYAVLALPAGAALIGFTSLGKLWAWWRGEGGTEPRGRA